MTWLPRARSFLSALFRRRQLEAEMEQEWQAHLDARTDALVAAGLSPVEATRRARAEFGDPLRWKEQARDVRGVGWFHGVGADVRYGLRLIRRAPWFAATVLVTLAVGVGLNTAVFSVVDAVLVRPLAYPDAERLRWITTVNREDEFEFVTAPDFLAWREQATSFDGFVAFDIGNYALSTADTVVQSRIASVSEDFWTLSGARPMLGRLPHRGEDAVLLSYQFVGRLFGGNAPASGSVVRINGRPVIVAGVLPPGFRAQMTRPPAFLGPPDKDIDAYRTLTVTPPANGQVRLVSVFAKLKAGVSDERAQAELQTIRDRVRAANPNVRLPPTLRVMPLKTRIVGDAGRALIVLQGAVGFVFLIACANIANLLLARASARRREVAIRVAIGAGRGRLARQFFIESALIATAAAAAGLVIARWGVATIVQILPGAVPRLQETTIDSRALTFAVVTAIGAAIVFGTAPVWSLWAADGRGLLQNAFTSALSVGGRLRTRTVIVGVEFALTIVLLIGAGLMIKSLWRLNALPEGFHPDRIVTMKVQFAGPRYREEGPRRAYVAEVLRRMSSTPEVVAAAITTNGDSRRRLVREGGPLPSPQAEDWPSALVTVASADFARVMGLPLIRGRWLSDAEPSPAVVINETLARSYFGDADPIGTRFQMGDIRAESWARVVGVVADRKLQRLDAPPEPELYVDYAHGGLFSLSIVAYVATQASAAAPELRRSVAAVDGSLPVFEIETLETALAESIAPQRFHLFTLALFGGVALMLAAVGIYGVLAYSISRRTQEMGIRLALGAPRGEVVGMVVREGMSVAFVGTMSGLVAGLALARVMTSLLHDVAPSDPYVFAAASAVLLLAGFAATLGPALKAASVEPVVALRCE